MLTFLASLLAYQSPFPSLLPTALSQPIATPAARAMELIATLAFTATALAAIHTDLQELRIPDRTLAIGAAVIIPALVAASGLTSDFTALNRALVGAALSFGWYLALHIAGRGALGFGDVKFAALIGLVTGWYGIRVTVFAFLAGFAAAGLGVLALWASRQATHHSEIPMAPWLAFGAAAALLAH